MLVSASLLFSRFFHPPNSLFPSRSCNNVDNLCCSAFSKTTIDCKVTTGGTASASGIEPGDELLEVAGVKV